jgi:hypothetical protein
LPPEAGKAWRTIICELGEANVPLQQVDSHGIAMFALTILEAEKATAAGDLKLAARLGRDALQWAGAIGATPTSRLRMSIRPVVERPDDDPWSKL